MHDLLATARQVARQIGSEPTTKSGQGERPLYNPVALRRQVVGDVFCEAVNTEHGRTAQERFL
jgi:hypothetical protein